MPADRLSVWGDKKQTGLTVLSSYTSTDSWPLVTFQSNSANYASTILNVVQGGTGKIATFYKGSTEAFTFGSDQTFLIGQRTGVPSSTSDRLYNVGGVLYWNGSSICTLASGCGVTSLWSDAGTYTYLKSTSDNLVLGGDSLATAKFFFDVTNGRLGIGTSSPTAKLDIAGDNSIIKNTFGDLTIMPAESLVVKANDTNPDNLQEWQDSVGTILALINSSGYASFGGVGTGSSILSLVSNTGGLSQINLGRSENIDVLNPSNGDLWWNGTELYFYDGNRNTNLLTGGKEQYITYGLVSDNGYLTLGHEQNTYAMEAQGYVCVGGEEDANCTGGQWKNMSDWGKIISQTGYLDWYTAEMTSSNVNFNTGDIELGSNKSYGIYTSGPIKTTGAEGYGDISWTESKGSTGKISVLTRSGTLEQTYNYMTDHSVLTQQLSPDGRTLYLGGGFFHIYEEYYGSGFPIDVNTGKIAGSNCAITTTEVYTSISDGNGGWYVGSSGSVKMATNVSFTSYLFHMRPDCSLDPDFKFSINSAVYSLYLNGNVLYLGGTFTSIGGQTRNRLAAIDLTTKAVTSFNANVNGIVRTMVLGGNILYIGGDSTSVGGQTRNRIAGIDITTGLVTSLDPNASDVVLTLILNGDLLYAGGYFTSLGGQDRNRFAAIDTATGLVTSLNIGFNAVVRTMLLYEGILYVGGDFTNAGGQGRNYIAAINVVTGSVTSFNLGFNSGVYAIQIGNGIMYLGGNFTYVGGKNRARLVAVDLASGVVTDFIANFTKEVYTLQLTGNILYVGGIFSSMTNSLGGNKVGAINTESGLVTSFDPNANGSVNTMILKDNLLYVGGDFTSIGGQSRNRLAATDTTMGLATSFNPNVNGTVYAMLLSGNTLYIGGSFTSVGGQTRNRLAAVDITTGLVTSFNPNVNGTVYNLEINNGILYVGGDFTTIGGQTRNRIGGVDATTGAVVDFNPNADGIVRALEVGDNILYVGGEFTSIGGQTRNKIAAIDMTTGLATSLDLNANNYVRTILLDGTTLYVGGAFTSIGGQSRGKVASIDLATGFVTSFNPAVSYGGYNVWSLLLNGNVLYIGGDYWSVGGRDQSYFAPIDITTSKILVKRPAQWTSWSDGSVVMSLNNANDHTTWVGSGATVSDGDKTRSVTYFEDENETVAGNTTKVVSTSSGQYVQSTISSSDLSNYDYISMWVYSNQVGTSLRLSIGEDTSNLKNNDITINTANTWQKVYWNISGIPVSERDGITILRVTNLSSSSNTFYIDNVSAELLPSDSNGYRIPNPADDYIQYRVIFTNTDGTSQPKLTSISMEYLMENTDYDIEYTDSNTIKMHNGSGSNQYLKIKATKGDTQFVSNIPDKGDAVAFSFNTTNSIINENTKLFSINNSGTEKMYIDAYGNLYLTGEVISNNTKYLKISPITAQTDGISNSNSIWINKTSTGGNLVKLQNNSTDMFVVNNTGDVSTHGTIQVDGGILKLGDSGNIRFNSGSGEVEISKDGGSTWVKVGGSNGKIVISAEYDGAVISKDGGNNKGDVTSNNTGSSNNSMNYYEWNSSEAVLNDIDIKVRFTLPSDFGSWGSGGITVHYATESILASNNNIGLYIYEQGKTTADFQQENLVSSSAEVWNTSLLSGSELNECVGSGTTCVLDIKLSSLSDNYVRVGNIVLEYVRIL